MCGRIVCIPMNGPVNARRVVAGHCQKDVDLGRCKVFHLIAYDTEGILDAGCAVDCVTGFVKQGCFGKCLRRLLGQARVFNGHSSLIRECSDKAAFFRCQSTWLVKADNQPTYCSAAHVERKRGYRLDAERCKLRVTAKFWILGNITFGKDLTLDQNRGRKG